MSQSGPGGRPYFEARKQAAEYHGPGRDEEPPAGLQEVRIAYFGPEDAGHAGGGSVRQGVELALAEANHDGGYLGLPFRLLSSWSENPWGSGIGGVTRAVYYDRVWAIIGGIDGPTTHLAEQVAVKARLPLVSPVSSDKTANLANVPWIFSIAPGDHQIAPAIVDSLLQRAHPEHFVLLTATDHDSHLLFREVRKELHARKSALLHHFQFKAGEVDRNLVRKVLLMQRRIVVLLGGIEDSARMILALRAEGFSGEVIGGPSMCRTSFLAAAGASAEGILCPVLVGLGERTCDFVTSFVGLYGKPPDYAAANAYDAARMLVAAIRTAGLNRARIADALRDLSPWQGVSGFISWDPAGQNVRSVRMAAIRNARLESEGNCAPPGAAAH
jgi:branched-chain amino acid transport system substrate-binding protein